MRGVWLLCVMAFMVCIVFSPFGGVGPPSVSQVRFDAAAGGAVGTVGNPIVRQVMWPVIEATAILDAALAM
jgi:hypothetical protein